MSTLLNTGKIQMLSLWQPWASLCVKINPTDGKAEKQIETRHWFTNYRGLLAIHATKTLVPAARLEIQTNQEIEDALLRHDVHPAIHGGKYLTFGAIVGVVTLDSIVTMTAGNEFLKEFPEREKSFGLYEVGRFGWILTNPIEFDEPILCRGLQGIGAPRPEIVKEIESRLLTATVL